MSEYGVDPSGCAGGFGQSDPFILNPYRIIRSETLKSFVVTEMGERAPSEISDFRYQLVGWPSSVV